jgi:hypothetical protein
LDLAPCGVTFSVLLGLGFWLKRVFDYPALEIPFEVVLMLLFILSAFI